jgi:hypothetical protein
MYRSPIPLPALCAAALACAVATAQERRAAEASTSRPAQYASWAELEKQILAERSGPKVAETWTPVVEEFAKRMGGKDDALCARLWLLQQTWWQREAGTMAESSRVMAEQILADYPRSPQLAKIAEYAYVFSDADRVRILEDLAKSGVAPVEAASLHALGSRELRAKDEETKKRGEARFKVIAEKHKDVPFKHTTYGALAHASLNQHASATLAVGAQAPEIVGTDVDCKPLKLSDHRGKVVVLDFWGFW